MILIELTGPAEEPVTLTEAKDWARIERSDEDALIGRLISAARETVESQTGLVLGVRSFRLVAGSVPENGRIAVGRRPVIEVTGATAYDRAGEPSGIEPGSVAIVGAEVLAFAPGFRPAGGVEIELTAGLAAGAVPQSVKLAMLRIVAASYETRGLVGPDMQPALMPPLAKALLSPYRPVRL